MRKKKKHVRKEKIKKIPKKDKHKRKKERKTKKRSVEKKKETNKLRNRKRQKQRPKRIEKFIIYERWMGQFCLKHEQAFSFLFSSQIGRIEFLLAGEKTSRSHQFSYSHTSTKHTHYLFSLLYFISTLFSPQTTHPKTLRCDGSQKIVINVIIIVVEDNIHWI